MLANPNVDSSADNKVKRVIAGAARHRAAYAISEEASVKVRVSSAKQENLREAFVAASASPVLCLQQLEIRSRKMGGNCQK